MRIEVTYMSGAGNLFTVVNGSNMPAGIDNWSRIAPALCHDGAIRTEGLLVVSESRRPGEFNVQFYNPDGSYGAMCGNGGRCAVAYAARSGFIGQQAAAGPVLFNMLDTQFTARIHGHQNPLSDTNIEIIELWLPPAQVADETLSLVIGKESVTGAFINTGTYHFVIDFSMKFKAAEFEKFDLAGFAPAIRHHERFEPSGVNVNIYYVLGRHELLLRTFEKGVEAETGACGTGALATAMAAAFGGHVNFPVNIIPTSGIALNVNIDLAAAGGITAMRLLGPAEFLWTDEIEVTAHI